MNIFDSAVYLAVAVAVIAGFNAGLLRSMATIFGYVCAMPIAVAATPYISPMVAGKSAAPWMQSPVLFFFLFLIMGIVLGGLFRFAVSDSVGPSISWADRLAGSGFGAVRAVLVAVMLVLVFDRLIPADRQPDFLIGSHLRPILSVAGQTGVRSLPPETAEFIDQLRREQRM
jgi:membrane protein required for colicin V production